MKSLDNHPTVWSNNYMTSTRSPFARSNAKQHFEITAVPSPNTDLRFAETCHGGGIGAWSKMMDRINQRLFGTTNVSLTALNETEDGASVLTLRCHLTDRVLTVVAREVQK